MFFRNIMDNILFFFGSEKLSALDVYFTFGILRSINSVNNGPKQKTDLKKFGILKEYMQIKSEVGLRQYNSEKLWVVGISSITTDYTSPLLIKPSLLQWKFGLIRGVASIEGDYFSSILLFQCIWNPSRWWEWPFKRGITVVEWWSIDTDIFTYPISYLSVLDRYIFSKYFPCPTKYKQY